jgi:hypothetical protein
LNHCTERKEIFNEISAAGGDNNMQMLMKETRKQWNCLENEMHSQYSLDLHEIFEDFMGYY